jgi:hypothetical protein
MRIFAFILVVLAGMYLPYIFFICVALLYAVRYTGHELFFVGVGIDALFGNPENTFSMLYTIGVFCIILITTYAKPYLRFYA